MFHTNRYNSCSIFFIPFFGYGFCKLTPQGNWKRIENSATRSMRHTQSKHKFFSSFSAIHTYIFYILWVYREGVTGGGEKLVAIGVWVFAFSVFGFCCGCCVPSPFTALLPLVRLQLSFPVWFARGQTIWAALKFHTLIYSFSEHSQSQSRAEQSIVCFVDADSLALWFATCLNMYTGNAC